MTTLTLPFRRTVAQANTGSPEAKANYKALAQRNALALEECPWQEFDDKGVKASLAEHDFAATFTDEKYDAFCMTGSYDSNNNTEIAYAGMVAYRFKLPQDYLSGSATLVSASVMLSRDRFLLPGLRVSAVLSNSATPSSDWSVVRGDADGCAKLEAQLLNPADRITAAQPATEAVTVPLAGMDDTRKSYLWIYLTVEDYTATWTWYSSTQHRLYAIEGSGMVIAESTAVTFSADVTPDEGGGGDTLDFLVVSGGITPLVPAGASVGVRRVIVRADATLVADDIGDQSATRSATGTAGAAALSRLYAQFYGGDGFAPVKDSASLPVGARFDVNRTSLDLPTAESDTPIPTDVFVCDSSVLVLPFVLPRDTLASRVTLSFGELACSTGARFNVWAVAGYSLALAAEVLNNPGLHDGEGFDATLLGTITGGASATFDLGAFAKSRAATLVISGWLPPECYNLGTGGAQGTGVLLPTSVTIL